MLRSANSETRRRAVIWHKATALLHGRKKAPQGIDYLYREIKGVLDALADHKYKRRLPECKRQESNRWLDEHIPQDYEQLESLTRQIEQFFEARRR